MFYAARHMYGIEFINDYMVLFRFTTKRERDEFVDDANFDDASAGSGYRNEAVTRDEARRHFPKAFRTLEFHDEPDARDWRKGETETEQYWYGW